MDASMDAESRDGSIPPLAPPSPRLGTAEHFRWLRGVVAAVLILNGIDAVLTLLWVYAGLAEEANPLLAELVHEHPVLFAACKIALVGAGSLLLWRARHRPLAIVGIFAVFLVYYAILLLHVGYLSWIVGTLVAP